MCWTGPFQLLNLFQNSTDDGQDWPPVAGGVYLVSLNAWEGEPDAECEPLYVGSNTGSSNRFCTRIGDLVADMLGFYDGGTGHHSGGQSLWKYCRKNNVKPLDLYLGWDAEVTCPRCAEIEAYETLLPELNKKRPNRCGEHPR